MKKVYALVATGHLLTGQLGQTLCRNVFDDRDRAKANVEQFKNDCGPREERKSLRDLDPNTIRVEIVELELIEGAL